MFLANENFPKPSVDLLRASSIEVESIQERYPGIPDEEVLQKAIDSNLIILTFDKDYGEMIFRYGIRTPPAVIYFREKGQQPLFAGEILVTLLKSKSFHFENRFTVIEKGNIRQRFYKK